MRFKDEAHLLRIINKIVSGVRRRTSVSAPTGGAVGALIWHEGAKAVPGDQPARQRLGVRPNTATCR